MEPSGNPMALRRVAQEAWSPSRAPGTGQDGTSLASVTSSPCSASSIHSTTRLVNYGADMNRDFAVISLLEEKLGRDVEHEELQAAIVNFRLVHGQLPSIRQLAVELSSCDPARRYAGDTSMSPVRSTPNKYQLPTPLRFQYNFGASPCVAVRNEHSSPVSLHPLLAQATNLGLLPHDPLVRLHSPDGRPHQGLSRFCPPESPVSRTPLGSSHQREAQYAVASPVPKQLRFLCGDADAIVPNAGDLVVSTLDEHQPAMRPFVPGLNLRGLKKKSPTLRSVASPPTTSAGETPVPHLGAQGGVGNGIGKKTPDTCSPTEILRMLLPSACKPRPSANAGVQARSFNALLAQSASEQDLVDADTRVEVNGGLDSCEVRQLRVSMDDIDQQPTGLRRMTLMKAMQATSTATTPDLMRHKATPLALNNMLDKHHRSTPPPRGRRHYQQDQHDQDLGQLADCVAEVAATDTASMHGTTKRHLLMPDQSGANDPAAVPDSCERCSLVDSDLRKDTPSRIAATARVAVGTTRVSMQFAQTGQGPMRGPVVAPVTDAADEDAMGVPQLVLQMQGFTPVPPLQLPAPYGAARPPGAGAAVPITRRRQWSTNSGPPNGLAAAVARLPLQPGGSFDPEPPVPMEGRTRRLSVCLPSTMVYGEGPLTARGMAAGANTGVTSHALCTVFWAESEDDLDMHDDSDTYDGYGLDEDLNAEHGEGNVLACQDEMAAVASQHSTPTMGAAIPIGTTDSLPQPGNPADGTQSQLAQQGHNRPNTHRRRGLRGGRARRREGHRDGVYPDRCGGELMLPEQLWDAWERLSDGPKGRQYRLLESLTQVERITCTSYSTVSKACHQGQPVVVKIYDVAEKDKLANAFAEIGVLLHLAGWPGAVRLLDYGRHEDKVMLMLESCDRSLKDWCDSLRFETATGADYIAECLRLWCTLAELLTELHERWHVAHCDLKPGNVLLSGGRLRLADFSESMLFNETPLLQDQARGTVPYQPPEMVHGHCVDARKADVWAMGCILYEMITGELLFRGNNDCMRAVAAGAAARLRQQQAHRNRRRRGPRGTGDAPGWQRPQHQPPCTRHRDVSAAPALVSLPLPQGNTAQLNAEQVALDLLDHNARGWTSRPAEGPEAGQEASAATVTATSTQPPRVPKLPLAQTRGVVCITGSPWEIPSTPPAATGTLAQLPPQAIPPHFFLGPGGGSAMTTGRSVHLIAPGSTAEDAWPLTMDPWIAMSVANTAPTTARSTAVSQVPYGYDTARSIASSSTAAPAGFWPPAPPPSAGTARSVADSEWTLAVTTTAAASTTAAGAGSMGYSGVVRLCSHGGPSSNRSADIIGHHCNGRGATELGVCSMAVEPQGQMFPPHRRLRHSVATQCADPAGPDWLTTEEADRLRIMCDEPPSFVLVHYQGGGGSSSLSGDATSGVASVRHETDRGDSYMTAVAEELHSLYIPRSLSGADGSSLCDDVLGLLRAILVEDHARPSMRQVAALAAVVLQRHCPQPPLPQPDDDSGGALVTTVAGGPKGASAKQHDAASASTDAESDLLGGQVERADSGQEIALASGGPDRGGSAVLAESAAWFYRSKRQHYYEGMGPTWLCAGNGSVDDRVANCGYGGVICAQNNRIVSAEACTGRPHATAPQFRPRLPQERPSSSYGDCANSGLAGTGGCGTGGPMAPLNAGTDGGSWGDSSSVGDDLGGVEPYGSCGEAAVTASGGSAPRSVNLFDMCQPLLTSRDSQPSSHSGQRVLTNEEP